MAGTYVLTVSLGFQTEADREEVSKARLGISNAPPMPLPPPPPPP